MNTNDLNLLVKQIDNIANNKPFSEDLKVTSPELAQLQQSIFNLSNDLNEINTFFTQLCMGNLDINIPSKQNFLSANLKELHADLKHLTWQANQVASGDYSQKVSFLGDFSVSFNKMIDQLSQRETILKQQVSEKELRVKQQSSMLAKANSLMMSVMDGLEDWIVVISKENKEVIYTNQSAKELCCSIAKKGDACGKTCRLINRLRQCNEEDTEYGILNFSCLLSNKDLRVKSFLIQWQGTVAYVHYILDVTYEREKREEIEELAYKDALTNLYNRRYCIEKLDHLIENQFDFSFCMLDLDALKFANDNFGHAAGDEYLKIVAHEMLGIARESDIVCRFGGDEFAMILPTCSEEITCEKISLLNQKLNRISKKYPLSISYGVVSVAKGHNICAEEIMALADEKMYIQKKLKNKMAR